MRKAQNVTEVVLLASVIAVVSLIMLAKFNNIKFDLASLANIKDNFAAGVDAKSFNGQNIENCIKLREKSSQCRVYKDSYGSPYVIVETTGTSGSTKSIVYLSTDTKSTTEGCIGMLLAGLAKSCYDSEGKEIECEKDEFGQIKSIKIDGSTVYKVTELTLALDKEGNAKVSYTLTGTEGDTKEYSTIIPGEPGGKDLILACTKSGICQYDEVTDGALIDESKSDTDNTDDTPDGGGGGGGDADTGDGINDDGTKKDKDHLMQG